MSGRRRWAAVRLRRNKPDHPRGYRAPALTLLCTVGFLASVAAMIIGFVPPAQFSSGSAGVYLLIVGGGLGVVGILVPALFYLLRKPHWKNPANVGGPEEPLVDAPAGGPEEA